MSTCQTKVRPSAAIATLMLHFVSRQSPPGYDCGSKRAVYSLGDKQGGCAVYVLMSPEQRARLTPATNTHEACPASDLAERGVLRPGDFFEDEGKVNGGYRAKQFLQDLQDAHDTACNIAVGFGLCNPDTREAALVAFRSALEGGLRKTADDFRLTWAAVASSMAEQEQAALRPA